MSLLAIEWERTAAGFYETQLSDGSIWRWVISSGEVSEVTDLHRRNPCLNASSLSAASRIIAEWIDR